MRIRPSLRSITILLVALATAHCAGAADDDVAFTVDAPDLDTRATVSVASPSTTTTTASTERKGDGGTKQDFLVVTMKEVLVSAY